MNEVTKVSVTAENIARGEACNGRRCPIALALLDALADQGEAPAWVAVDTYDAELMLTDGRRYQADLDPAATRFVEAFDEDEGSDDRDAAIAPFELELAWREVSR